MKLSLIFLLSTVCLSALVSAQSRIDSDAIVEAISLDSRSSAESYRQYANRLSKTLEQYSAESLDRIFERSVTAESSESNAFSADDDAKSPEEDAAYQAALAALNAAEQDYQKSLDALEEAEEYLRAVERDDFGFLTDGIPGNRRTELLAAENAYEEARDQVEVALSALTAAQNALAVARANAGA